MRKVGEVLNRKTTSKKTMSSFLSPASIVEKYDTEGFVVIEDLFSPSEVADWKKRIVTGLSAISAVQVDPSSGRAVSSETTGVNVWMAAGKTDPCPKFFSERLTGSEIFKVLNTLLGSPTLEFLSCKPVIKTSAVAFPTPWHQDYPCA